jgi:hypothetical protein
VGREKRQQSTANPRREAESLSQHWIPSRNRA